MACECKNPALKDCTECVAYEAEQRASRRADRIARAGLPRDLRELSLLGAHSPEAAKAARDWANSEIRGLCLTGPTGVGKTWLAAAATWARLQNYGVKWVSTARLMTQLRAGFGSEMKKKADAIVAGSGAIVLDDLDKANPSEFGREVLFAAVDNRVEEGSPLLVTTNLPLSRLSNKLGGPIASRLAGYCTTVHMVGEDRRLG